MKNHFLKDNAVTSILGFFVAKGLLFVPEVPPNPMAKLDLGDVLDVARSVEPRIIEVLPAALIHFPKSFTNHEALPDKLKLVIDLIKRSENHGPDIAGIKFSDMKRWANIPLKDSRIVPVNEKRVMKSIRLKPETIQALKSKAKSLSVTETELVEALILKA